MAETNFCKEVKATAHTLREAMQVCETMHDFYFRVECRGRLHDGSIKITYEVGEGSYIDERVEGNDPGSCLMEYMRRHGWDAKNAPLSITFEGKDEEIDEPTSRNLND